jgi:hypothetical protein
MESAGCRASSDNRGKYTLRSRTAATQHGKAETPTPAKPSPPTQRKSQSMLPKESRQRPSKTAEQQQHALHSTHSAAGGAAEPSTPRAKGRRRQSSQPAPPTPAAGLARSPPEGMHSIVLPPRQTHASDWPIHITPLPTPHLQQAYSTVAQLTAAMPSTSNSAPAVDPIQRFQARVGSVRPHLLSLLQSSTVASPITQLLPSMVGLIRGHTLWDIRLPPAVNALRVLAGIYRSLENLAPPPAPAVPAHQQDAWDLMCTDLHSTVAAQLQEVNQPIAGFTVDTVRQAMGVLYPLSEVQPGKVTEQMDPSTRKAWETEQFCAQCMRSPCTPWLGIDPDEYPAVPAAHSNSQARQPFYQDVVSARRAPQATAASDTHYNCYLCVRIGRRRKGTGQQNRELWRQATATPSAVEGIRGEGGVGGVGGGGWGGAAGLPQEGAAVPAPKKRTKGEQNEPVKEWAHRMVCWCSWGPPPAMSGPAGRASTRGAMEVVHLCHNKRCLNPLHLAWGTPRENSLGGARDAYNSVILRRANSSTGAVWALHGVLPPTCFQEKQHQAAPALQATPLPRPAGHKPVPPAKKRRTD